MKDACYRYSSITPGLLPWQSYALAFVIGILGIRHPIPAFACLLVLYAVDTSLREKACRLPLLAFLCCAAFGYGYAVQRTPEPPVDIPVWMEARRPVEVHGIVDRVEPRTGDRLRVVLKDVRCLVDGKSAPLPGKVVWNNRRPKYQPVPGQSVAVVLRVMPVRGFGNPGMWDYGWYWQRQGVFWRAWKRGKQPPEWGGRTVGSPWMLKAAVRHSVADLVPDTQGGAMVLALTTGDKSRLDLETVEATRKAGLAHTLALSGLHVGFVAAMGVGLAFLIGWIYPPLLLSVPRPKLAVFCAAPLVLGYAWLGQPSASLIRAATMFGFWGLLLLQGRGRVLMDGLFFALAAIVFVSPLSAFDLSLQMSVAAVAGISLMYPYFRFLFSFGQGWHWRLLGWAGGLLAVSLCANIALMPLVSWYFGTWNPNILLNLVWIPVLGFVVMPLGLAGMLLSGLTWATPLAGVLLGWAGLATDWLLWLLHTVVESGMTPVFAVLRPLWPEMLGTILLLTVVVAVWKSARRVPVELVAVGFVLLVFPHVSVMVEDSRDKVRLTMLDVGLGQSLVVSVPGGKRWLIDGGGGTSTFDLGTAVVAPALTHGRPPRLEGVFMTHPDVDHSHGLSHILEYFDVESFYTNGMHPRGRTGKRLSAAFARRGMEPEKLEMGGELRLADGILFEVLHPSASFTSRRANERSLVMRLVREGHPLALLPGDIELGGIQALLENSADLRADVLVLPHHGSRYSLSTDFYSAVAPEKVLCSNGYLNRYGFPDPEVVAAMPVPILSTERQGRVDIVWGIENDLSVQAFVPEL